MKKLKTILAAVGLLIAVGMLLVAFSRPFNKVSNRREITATVTDKEVKNKKEDSKYLVYTKDENGEIQVFEITDALFAWQFDSSDIYAGIEIGKTYVFDVGGSRNKFSSWYPNIYGYEEVKSKD